MTSWACGIAGCGEAFQRVEQLIRHQASDHPPSQCKVCGETLPSGFVAIQHAFEEHTRAEYVRAYDANSDDIRHREQIKDFIETRVDVPALIRHLQVGEDPAVTAGD